MKLMRARKLVELKRQARLAYRKRVAALRRSRRQASNRRMRAFKRRVAMQKRRIMADAQRKARANAWVDKKLRRSKAKKAKKQAVPCTTCGANAPHVTMEQKTVIKMPAFKVNLGLN